jgi:hypothetical protein
VEWIYARAAPAHSAALFEANVAPLTVVIVSGAGDAPDEGGSSPPTKARLPPRDEALVRVCRAAAAALTACPSASPSIFVRVPASTNDDWLILACRASRDQEHDILLLVGSAQPGTPDLLAARRVTDQLPLPRVLRVRR